MKKKLISKIVSDSFLTTSAPTTLEQRTLFCQFSETGLIMWLPDSTNICSRLTLCSKPQDQGDVIVEHQQTGQTPEVHGST